MSTNGKTGADVSLVTGFPAFTAKRLVRTLVTAEPNERV